MRQGRSPALTELRLSALQDQGDLLALRKAASAAAADPHAHQGDLAEAIAFWSTAPPAQS
jgi:hypothetical protein